MTPDEFAAFRRDVQRIYFEPLDDLARQVGVMGPTERARWRDVAREYHLRLIYRTGVWSSFSVSRPLYGVEIT